MGRTWTEAQNSAITLRGKTVLVCAAAGSGKTSVLTERIIRSLTDPDSPADISRMLVVTFTRAAAAELKTRIAQALSDAMARDPANKHLSRQLFLLGSAQISTIDSFFQKAVRANFEQLSIPATFRLADDAELLPLKTSILEELTEEFYRVYEKKDRSLPISDFAALESNPFACAMDHLLSNRSDGRATSLLLDFRECYAADPKGTQVLAHLAERMQEECEQEYLTSGCGAFVKEELLALFTAHLTLQAEIRNALSPSPDLLQKCDAILSSDERFCRSMLTALEEGSYARVREVAFSFVTGRFPTIREKTDAVLFYQEWRNRFKADVTKHVQPLLQPTAEELRRQMQKTAAFLRVLHSFYTAYEERLFAEKKERAILEYNDVRALLFRLLTDENGEPTPFADTLAAQYDSVYIDEYQDVDFLQDRIFSIIGGNRRFMVGDIKQSIYGFRGSEPSIFAGYRRILPPHTSEDATRADGVCVFMSDNFRCDEPVIRFANRVCAFLFSACSESIGYLPQDDLVFSKTPAPSPAEAVRFAVFDPKPRNAEQTEEAQDCREEAVWVAAEISRLLQNGKLDDGTPIQPNDIAILVRARAHGAAYEEELKKLSVPVASLAAGELLRSPLLTDLLNLLRAIDNPFRDLPLSECLLSPFFSLHLEEISAIRAADDTSVSLWEALQRMAESSDPLAATCREICDFFDGQRESAAVLPADRFLRRLYADARISPYAGDAVLLFLYEQARIYQRTSFCGLYGFLSHFSKLLEGGKLSAGGFEKAESAVTVMTIHHSKGLEFPVVFLCSTGAAFSKDDLKKPMLYHRSVGFGAKLYNHTTGESEDTALRAALKLRIDAESTEESIRTLYVALTRARERLYVTGTLSGKWENALANAKMIRRGDRNSILHANSTLTWLLAAMQEKDAQAIPCEFLHIPYGSVEKGAVPAKPSTPPLSLPSKKEAPLSDFAMTRARAESFRYPWDTLRVLPSKLAASKITPDLLDRLNDDLDERTATEMQIELMRAAHTTSFDLLLESKDTPTAAERGSATHAFLQFCDLRAMASRSVKEECARLLEMGFLDKHTVSILHGHQLEAFARSELLAWILQATEVRREQKFALLLPAAGLTQNPDLARTLAAERIFVQGSIDLLLRMPNGERLLIDYKTDRIPKEESDDPARLQARMKAEHGEQLKIYAEAVRALFGAPPDRSFIYSLPLGKLIAIS